MKRLLLPLMSITLLAAFKPAPAPMITPAPGRIDGGPVIMSVLDRDTGEVQPQYRHGGQRWTAGERGHRYSVRLRNASPQRVLVVLSVDGINAISGEPAAPGQTGYVLDPWQSTDIAGWRKKRTGPIGTRSSTGFTRANQGLKSGSLLRECSKSRTSCSARSFA